ncbi:DoxX family protein [Microbacterium karelineae]|uniref:DoxX family protein n=1 Tax=Microbacterium karelineae TaxID=2654283 RepID=UPI0012E9B774|nr:DoxX family protein [Microbacterium karelineae]
MPSQKTSRALNDIGLVVLRIVVGGIAFAHGLQKILTNGVDGTAGWLGSMGVPLPDVAAVVVIAIELIGGLMLVLGLAQRVVGILLAADMIGAIALVHAPFGVFVADGGWELAALLGAAGLALSLTGSGAYSIDGAIASRRRR